MPDQRVATVRGELVPRPEAAAREARPQAMPAARGAYAVSVLAVLTAGALNWLLWDWIRPQAGALLLTAVVVSAWYGGLGPGIFASLLATVARAVFYAEPLFSPLIEWPDVLLAQLFLAVALFVSWLTASRRAAMKLLERARAELELRVQQRTAELTAANANLRQEIEERSRIEQRLRHLASELSTAEERERRRVAARLHDDIGQTLASAQIRLDAVPEESTPEGVARAVGEVRGLIEETIGKTRLLTSDLSPPVLYEMGFEDAIRWLAGQMRKRHGLAVDVWSDGRVPELDEQIRALLFHAVRELLVNVVKHAGADRTSIGLATPAPQRFRVTVEDDGVGVRTAGTSARSVDGLGFGLFNIRERLRSLGGDFSIDAAGKRGTRVVLEVPLNLGGEAVPAIAAESHDA